MHADDPRDTQSLPDEVTPDAVTQHLDPGALKGAHGRTGRMLQNAGLPFEDDEFDEDDSSSSEESSGSSNSEEE